MDRNLEFMCFVKFLYYGLSDHRCGPSTVEGLVFGQNLGSSVLFFIFELWTVRGLSVNHPKFKYFVLQTAWAEFGGGPSLIKIPANMQS